jgi:hypothetical protein
MNWFSGVYESVNSQFLGVRFAGMLFSAVLLSGCAQYTFWSPFKSAEAPKKVVVAEPKPVVKPAPRPQTGIDRLLAQADWAFKRGRYTLPEEDNAFDRYRAVLTLDPNNQRARAGVDSVHMAYVDYVRAIRTSGNLPYAYDLIARGNHYFPGSPLLRKLSDEIRSAQAAANAARQKAMKSADISIPQSLDGAKVQLSEQQLTQRSAEVKRTLETLAKRVKISDESILILARNDREGRWIYQTMQEAVTGYRIRGDIQISRVPAIMFMEPL